jgi:nicotine blue oxidoreductase
MTDSDVAGIVLAAGAGSRYGGPKPLLRLGDATLLEHAVGTLIDGGCRAPIHVVLGKRLGAPLPAIAAMRPTWNLTWREGIGSSLRHALATVEQLRGIEAAVVLLVDQPGVRPAAVERLIAAYRDGAAVAVATYAGRRGHPVLLRRTTWAGVRARATGESGARAVMNAHPELVTDVVCDDAGTDDDIDTPDDLARLRRELEDRPSCT